jgi:hypothetical protein
MGQELSVFRPLQGSTPKKWTKQIPSSKELAEQYFDLQCLRQYVEMAETNQTADGTQPNRRSRLSTSLS